MGTTQSKVQFCSDQQYKIQKQTQNSINKQTEKNNSFFKVQSCHYPHPLMENHKKRQSEYQSNDSIHKCTMKHQGYPSTYNLCSKCQKYPHKVSKNNKLFYQKDNYTLSKPDPIRYDYKPSKYKQKDILAPGPQIPAFYNGFTLPLDRYYKQKTNYIDHTQPAHGSIYRDESKSFEQSVYQQISDKPHSHHRPKEIEYDDHLQNLKI